MNEFLKKVYLLPSSIFNFVLMKFYDVKLGSGVVINGRIRLYGKGHIELGDRVKINSTYRMNPIGGNLFTSIYIKDGASVEIGRDSGISNVSLYASERIHIGERVKIGGSVKIYDTDFHSIDYKDRQERNDPGIKSCAVFIGDDCFIGAHSIILKGVKIGDRSVIGAGSVVTSSIPADEIWGGAPARLIRKLEDDNIC